MMASGASSGGSGPAGVSAELRRQLMAELERLPAALRETVVRHYLGGQTRAQLAEELGLPSGTVNSRLNAGIERLRARLSRRGVALAAAALGPALAAAGSGSAPASLLASLPALASGSTAALAAAGAGDKVVALAEGVLKMMFWEKVRVVAVATSIAAALAIAVPVAVSLAADGGRETAPIAAPAAPVVVEPIKAPEKAPAVVTAKVREVGKGEDLGPGRRSSLGIFLTELSGPVWFGAKATCKAKGWTSTVTLVSRDGAVLKLVDGAAAGDAVEIEVGDGIQWGEPAGGLQLGLSPGGAGDSRGLFLAGDPLALDLHFRVIVDGELRLVHASPALPDFRITFTPAGKASLTAQFDPAALPPNAAGQVPAMTVSRSQDRVCPLAINDQWRFVGDSGEVLKKLSAGKYTVRVVYEPQLAGERISLGTWTGKVASGVLEIEIKASPATNASPASAPVSRPVSRPAPTVIRRPAPTGRRG